MTKKDAVFTTPFYKRLRQALEIKKINQKQLADLTGLSPVSISYYVNGKCLPKRDVIAQLAELLEVDPGWLMGLDKIEDPSDALAKENKIKKISKNLNNLSLDEINLTIRLLEALFLDKVNFKDDS